MSKRQIDDDYVESAKVYFKVTKCTTIVIKCTLCNEVELTDWSHFKKHLAVQHPVYSRFGDYEDINQDEEIQAEVELEIQNLSKSSQSIIFNDLSTSADCQNMKIEDSSDKEELERAVEYKRGVLSNPKQPFYSMAQTSPEIMYFFIDQIRQHRHVWAQEYRNQDFKPERLESATQISQALAKKFNVTLTPQIVRLSACGLVKWFQNQFSLYLSKPGYRCRYQMYYDKLQAFVSTDNISVVKCDECKRTFCSQNQLQGHKFRQHCGSYPHVCNECNAGFSYACQLRRHQIRHHNTQSRWQCTFCNYCATNKWDLQVHLPKHSDERYFVCQLCGLATKSRSSLEVHRRTHLEAELKCPFCPKICTLDYQLRSHIKRMHAEKLKTYSK